LITYGEFFSYKNFSKSQLGFRKWTKKMSKIEKPKKVLKKPLFLGISDENALNSEKITQKSVTIKFYNFKENHLGTFLVSYYETK
jgi:hypothetical protein